MIQGHEILSPDMTANSRLRLLKLDVPEHLSSQVKQVVPTQGTLKVALHVKYVNDRGQDRELVHN